jgi:hypothetical protein
MGFLNFAIILRILLGFFQVFYAILEISWDFVILGFSKILGFFQRFFGIFDVYEDFQSNLPLGTGIQLGISSPLSRRYFFSNIVLYFKTNEYTSPLGSDYIQFFKFLITFLKRQTNLKSICLVFLYL